MGVFAGAIGRKKTIMLFSLPLLVGWVVMFISNGDTILLCLGRIFQGIGTMSSVTQVYLVEVADAQRRQGHLREQFKIDAEITKYCPKCSVNPIRVTPIWKWEFENKDHPIRGLYMTFFEKFLFKFPFSHKRFQMGQKMYFYQLYKL